MPAATHDLAIEQGATFRLPLTLTGLALDGLQARMQVRATQPAPAVLIELTTENGRILLDPATSEAELYISAADTAALSFDKAVYDLELVTPADPGAGQPDELVTRLLQGRVRLLKEVTR